MDESTYLAAKEEFERKYCTIVSPPLFIGTWQGQHHIVPPRSVEFPSPAFRDRWLRDPTKRSYDSVDFLPPPRIAPDGVFNLWLGLEAERLPPTPAGSVDRFLEHVSLITRYRSELFLDWCAHMVQRPGERTLTVIVLAGPEGSGKSMLVNMLAAVIGNAMFHDGPGCLLATMDSANIMRLGQKHRRVKQLVQSPTLTDKAKFKVSNFTRLIITTRDFGVPEWIEDLGCAFIQGDGDRVGDSAYFDTLDEYMKSPANIRAIYDFLAARQIPPPGPVDTYFPYRAHMYVPVGLPDMV